MKQQLEPVLSLTLDSAIEPMSLMKPSFNDKFSTGATEFSSMIDLVIKKPSNIDTNRTLPNIKRPKRPLTAYNLFFRAERENMIGVKDIEHINQNKKKRLHRKTHGIGFQQMAKVIGQKWKQLDSASKAVFEAEAAKDIKRYRKDMEVYRQTLHVMGLQGQRTTKKHKKIKQPEPIPSSQSTKVNISTITGTWNGPRPQGHLHKTLTQALEICRADKEDDCDKKQQSPTLDGEACDLEQHLRDALEVDIFDFMSKIQDSDNYKSDHSAFTEAISCTSASSNHTPCEVPSIGHDFEPLDWKAVDTLDDSSCLEENPCSVPSLGHDFEPFDIDAPGSLDESTCFVTLEQEFGSFLEETDLCETRRAKRRPQLSSGGSVFNSIKPNCPFKD